jgi:SAM-dependent methyltransferase
MHILVSTSSQMNFSPTALIEVFIMKWREIPSSKTIIKLLQKQLELILPSVHGYSLVTLGELSTNFNYKAADVANVIQINSSEKVDVCAHPHQLPLASDDIDAIFVPLLIEQSKVPHQLLREVVRSLRPGGKLILVTFNPLSSWGFHKLFLNKSGRKPWKYPFYRMGRLRDWLSLLGLDVTVEHGLFARLPGAEYQMETELISSVVYSRFGAVNFIVAEKKVKTLTAIRPNWQNNRVIQPTMISPTGTSRKQQSSTKEIK